jgi:hypothetical protein
MAKFVFGMNQSLDGYVDHLEMRTGPALFRHWIEHMRDLTGRVYGRRIYELMRYWDEDRSEWSAWWCAQLFCELVSGGGIFAVTGKFTGNFLDSKIKFDMIGPRDHPGNSSTSTFQIP